MPIRRPAAATPIRRARATPQVVLAALSSDACALMHASDALQDEEELVLKAVRSFGHSVHLVLVV